MTVYYDNVYEGSTSRITVRMELVGDQYRVTSRFYGKGTMDGARAFVKMLDGVLDSGPPDALGDSVLDTRTLDSAPLRSQLILAGWLIKNKSRVGRLAVLGAKPMIRRLATAVLKAARFTTVRFVRTPEEAVAWTGFCPE